MVVCSGGKVQGRRLIDNRAAWRETMQLRRASNQLHEHHANCTTTTTITTTTTTKQLNPALPQPRIPAAARKHPPNTQ